MRTFKLPHNCGNGKLDLLDYHERHGRPPGAHETDEHGA